MGKDGGGAYLTYVPPAEAPSVSVLLRASGDHRFSPHAALPSRLRPPASAPRTRRGPPGDRPKNRLPSARSRPPSPDCTNLTPTSSPGTDEVPLIKPPLAPPLSFDTPRPTAPTPPPLATRCDPQNFLLGFPERLSAASTTYCHGTDSTSFPS